MLGHPPNPGSELEELLTRVVVLAGGEGLRVTLAREPVYAPSAGYNPAGWKVTKPRGDVHEVDDEEKDYLPGKGHTGPVPEEES